MIERYALVRYYKNKKEPTVIEENLTFEQAKEGTKKYPTRITKGRSINSFVGFTKMSNL